MAECRLHPGMLAGPLCCRCPRTMARCQPASENVRESSVSGIMENHNTHLAPGFTLNDLVPALANVAILGVHWDQVASMVSTKCPSSSGTAFPRVAREPPGLHSAPGDSPFPPEHRQVWSCGVAAFAPPLFTVLRNLNRLLSPFSFLPF